MYHGARLIADVVNPVLIEHADSHGNDRWKPNNIWTTLVAMTKVLGKDW
jgi:hypothetical protein